MGDGGSGWDRSVEMAWVRFQRKLGDFVADLEDGDLSVVHALLPSEPEEGTGPFIRFSAHAGGTMVRAAAASNHFLAPAYQLTQEDVDVLVGGGWRAPDPSLVGEPEAALFVVEQPRRRADLVALMSVRALRDAFGVPHPAFLQGGPLEPAPVVEPGSGHEPERVPDFELMQLLRPESPEELDHFVAQTLTEILGREAYRDDDGDFPVRVGTVVLFVRPLASEPIIEVFSPLIRDIADRDRALLEVSILNRDAQFISYHLTGSTIVARMNVPAFPFVPNQLAVLLSRMADTLDTVDEDLSLRVGGRQWLDVERAAETGLAPDDAEVHAGADTGADTAPGADEGHVGQSPYGFDLQTGALADDGFDSERADDEEELPPELLALIQVDADGTERQPPELVASLFHDDMHLVLHSLRLAEEQTIAWRESTQEALEDDDEEEAAACVTEMRAWEKTVSDLRGALRLIVGRSAPGRWPT